MLGQTNVCRSYVTEERVCTHVLPVGHSCAILVLTVSLIEVQGSMCTALAYLIEGYRHNRYFNIIFDGV